MDLSDNKISDEGATSMANMLTANNTLKQLGTHTIQGYMTTASETRAHSNSQLRSK